MVSGNSFLNGMGPYTFWGTLVYVIVMDYAPGWVGMVDYPMVAEGIPVAVCS